LGNELWPLDEGWGTTLEVFSRPADVAYNGLNGTILWNQFPNDTFAAVNITAVELLQVFNVLFNTSNVTTTYGQLLSAIGIASNKPTEPFTIWQYFQGLVELARNDTRANTRAGIGLQSLLAIPIYHCQAKDFAELRQLLLEQIDNTTAIVQTLGQDLVNQFPFVLPDTAIYPALLRYSLQVGRGSLVAYIVVAGCTLLLCATANGLRSCTTLGRKCRTVGPFPLMTHLCDYKTVNMNAETVSLGKFQRLDHKEILSEAAEMHVKLAHTQQDDVFEGDGISLAIFSPGDVPFRSEGNVGAIDEPQRPRTI
jgi:hypothetical protein